MSADDHIAAARQDAREQELRDTDELTEWLTACCYRAKPSTWRPIQREKTAIDFLGWTTPDLIALLFDQGQPAQITRAVRDVLADRYCALESVADRIEIKASELARDMAEDDKVRWAA